MILTHISQAFKLDISHSSSHVLKLSRLCSIMYMMLSTHNKSFASE